jgi:hypothetical protein
LSLQSEQEWCERSVGKLPPSGGKGQNADNDVKKRKDNFFFVASRASSHHLVYRRDLVLLLNLSMNIDEFDLALDLGKLAAQILKLMGLKVSNFGLVQIILQRVRFLKPQS